MRVGRPPATTSRVRPLLAAALAVIVAACARGPGPVHVVSIRVAQGPIGESLREVGVGGAAIDDAVRSALVEAGFEIGEGGRPHRAEVEVLSVRLAPPNASGGPPRVEVAVQIELTSAEPARPSSAREAGAGWATLGPSPGKAWADALFAAARQASEGLALSFAAEAKPIGKAIEDLSSKDRRVRDHAIRVLAERRAVEAVPALIERLRDEDPRVTHRTIGALAQIGDERAVGPLIDLSRAGDPALAARVARLIGDIGGREAEGYLLTIEAGHPDHRVRSAAAEALAEMAERGRKAAEASASRK